ncbi:MAG: CtsR family transcriptional regulator [Methylocystaceae bacterium]
MSSLADKIEQYIKILIDRSTSGSIEIQRLELAETFACAPSQITYVISTRFNPQFGFWVESKRGGSGYVRVSRIQLPVAEWLSQSDAMLVLQQLLEEERITTREYFLLKVVFDSLGTSSELPAVEPVIGRVLQAVVTLL